MSKLDAIAQLVIQGVGWAGLVWAHDAPVHLDCVEQVVGQGDQAGLLIPFAANLAVHSFKIVSSPGVSRGKPRNLREQRRNLHSCP